LVEVGSVVDMDFSALSSLGYFPDAEAIGDSQSEARIEDASGQQASFIGNLISMGL
jgi:hypothetical protein